LQCDLSHDQRGMLVGADQHVGWLKTTSAERRPSMGRASNSYTAPLPERGLGERNGAAILSGRGSPPALPGPPFSSSSPQAQYERRRRELTVPYQMVQRHWRTFRGPWSDGTTHLLFSPGELIEKLVPLVPRLQVHTTRWRDRQSPST
jgi:hypothetical protein